MPLTKKTGYPRMNLKSKFEEILFQMKLKRTLGKYAFRPGEKTNVFYHYHIKGKRYSSILNLFLVVLSNYKFFHDKFSEYIKKYNIKNFIL